MASELKAQEIVHGLEHGRGRWWIICLLIATFALFQAVAHVMINPMNRHGGQVAIFVGLTHPKGMEQAVISREIARGNGFSTKVIKPAAIALMEKHQDGAGFSKYLDADPSGRTGVPDIYHAPLNPWINGLALKVGAKMSDLLNLRRNEQGQDDFWSLQPGEFIHPADRIICGVSVFFFLAGIGMSFLAIRRLFDDRLATLTVVLMLACNHFWKFSSTGLPQMLMLFLFSTAVWCLVRALGARENGGRTWHWHAGAGLAFGLLGIAHPITTFLFVGALIYTAVAFVPRWRGPLIMTVLFLACMTPWLVRNQRVCGWPFGIAGMTRLVGLQGSESQIMRTVKKDDDTTPAAHFRIKIQGGIMHQTETLVARTGAVITAPLFFLALLHVFKKRETRSMRWGLFGMMGLGVFGMSVFSFGDGDPFKELQSNDLWPLFIPFMSAYGLALVLVMWSRVEFAGLALASIRQTNIAFQSLLVGVSAFPLLNVYTDPPRTPFVWPPVCPPIIADLAEWYSPDNVICADMPWAVAWYADRRSLWLPYTVADFATLNELTFHGKVTGLFLTPITGNAGLLSEVGTGEYKEWRPFIMRDPRAAANFPLKVGHPIYIMNAANYLLFSDRDRWSRRND